MTAKIFDLGLERARRAAVSDDPGLAALRRLAIDGHDDDWSPTAYDQGIHTRLMTAGRYAAAEVKVIAGCRYYGHRGVVLGLSPVSWRYQVLLECGKRRLFNLQQLQLIWLSPYPGQVRQDPPADDPDPAA